jgi:hypothetical protein
MARNPATGEQVHVKAKTVAKVTALKGFKDIALGVAPAPKINKVRPPAPKPVVKAAAKPAPKKTAKKSAPKKSAKKSAPKKSAKKASGKKKKK